MSPPVVTTPLQTVVPARTPLGLPSTNESATVVLLEGAQGTGTIQTEIGGSKVDAWVPSSGESELAVLFQPLPTPEPAVRAGVPGEVALAFRFDVYSYDHASNTAAKRGNELSGSIQLRLELSKSMWESTGGNTDRLAMYRQTNDPELGPELEPVGVRWVREPWNPEPPLGTAAPGAGSYGSLMAVFGNRSVFLITVKPAAAPTPTSEEAAVTPYLVENPAVLDYFTRRGGTTTFGEPVSREFTFEDMPVQLFQRAMLRVGPEGGVSPLNLLEDGLLPLAHVNGSTVPAPDPEMLRRAPVPGTLGYDEAVLAFLATELSDVWDGEAVGFKSLFMSTVRLEDAFPEGDGDPDLVPFLNLEVWGLPVGKPARDPNNSEFVYQRFQRGVMHHDASNGLTQGLLVGDYLKSVMTGENLPADLAADASGSRFYLLYDRTKTSHSDRSGGTPPPNRRDPFEATAAQLGKRSNLPSWAPAGKRTAVPD